MILLIDNYDSFTFNLLHLIGASGDKVEVRRNDKISLSEIEALAPEAVVLSPGPCTPNEAGICLEVVRAAPRLNLPVFGVCLGMQSIVQGLGGVIRRADHLMHGKTCLVDHERAAIFADIPSPFTATRYHSLVADPNHIPESLRVTAHANDDGEVMAVEHTKLPIAGVQFHPESIASEFGSKLIQNFLVRARKASVSA